MKKQWLSIVLVLCMVLCMAPITARAAEGEKTCKLTINVEVKGLPDSISASAKGATFTFQIKRAINGVTAVYNPYDTMTVTVGADGKGTSTVLVQTGKYIVSQTGCSQQIGAYIWDGVSHEPGTAFESDAKEMTEDYKSITFTARNTYKSASGTKVTSLPITVTGYKADAKVADAAVTTTEPGIKLTYFRFMEMNPAGAWTPASTTGTFKADTDYKVEVYFNEIPGCDYTELKKENVTVNGVEADAFETTWGDSPKNENYRVVHGLGKPEVVKTVKSIKITTPPDKTTYTAGENFDPKGMVVTAVYDDTSEADLPETGYTIFHGDKLTKGQADVTIQYNDGSGSSNIKTYQAITVKPYVGPHTHTYAGSPWYQDATSHWHQCTDSTCPDPRASATELASHTFVWKVDQAATTTQTGLKHEECTVCRFKRNENTVIPVLTGTGVTTYPITVMSGKNGGVTVSHKTSAKGALVTLTVTPDKGYVLETLNVLDQSGSALPLTQQNGKFTFTMPASKVTVAATFKASAPTGKNPFIDVPAGSYYEDAVVWAVEKGITSGTSTVTFDPNGNCTRAQAVTFLWRAAGSPAAKSKVMPFTDVPSGSYYYDAVLWAMEQGITKGTSDTAFSPNASCTRAQIVTFLWRANGSPVVSGNSAFTDVASDAYYAAAVTWAEKNGVTGGIGGGLFGSGDTCTRAQIVTFLYRAMK